MQEKQKLFSLAAVVVAAVLFGMVIAGALNLTPEVEADRPPAPLPAAETVAVPNFVALADRVIPSVVSVYSDDIVDSRDRRNMPRDPFHFFFGPQRGPEDNREEEPMVRTSSGSGFFISPNELITNYHVIENADRIQIQLSNDTRYEVEVVGKDPATDIALLRVKKATQGFPSLPLGDSEAVRVGEWVMAVGNPLDMDHTVTVGVVSAKGRVLGLSESSFEDYIQTDAAINFGNSGGPLVNLRGEVVGINTAINARGQNLGFAVPVGIAKQILPQLRERGKVVRGYLGIMVNNIDQDTEKAFGLKSRDGAFVQEVLKDHAADKGGLQHGDVVVEIDGSPVTDTRQLIDTVSAKPPGTKVKLGVIRNGSRDTLTVVLEEREGESATGDLVEDEREGDETAERIGISVVELSPRTRQNWGVNEEIQGIVITQVRAVSPAGEEGLRRGDVITEANGRSVETVDDLVAQVSKVDEGGYLRLYVYRPRFDRSFFAILTLGE
jgi:serine protease Do